MARRVDIARWAAIGAVIASAAMFLLPAAADSPEERQIDFANGLFRKGYYDMAAEQYRAYLQDYPNGQFATDALLRLAESEYAAQRYEPALNAINSFLAADVADAAARARASARKGEILYRLKKYDEAQAALLPLTTDDAHPDARASALYYLGKLHFDAGDLAAAQTTLKALIESAPTSPLMPFARYQLAFVYLALDQPEHAAIEFSEAANSSTDKHLRMECRFRAAETYDKIGWFDAAVTAYQDLHQQFPNTPYADRAQYGYAWALYHAAKYDEALDAANRFIANHPKAPESVGITYLRGNCLQQQGRYEQAIQQYQAIRKDAPQSEFAARAQYRVAWVLFQMGKREDAERETDAFLANHADSPLRGDAAFLRGSILAAKGDYDDAYEEFRLVAEKYADSEFAPDALFKAGECLAQLGKIDEAGKAFETFAQKYPEHPLTEQAVLRVGDAQFLSAAFESATARYRAILDKQPQPIMEHEILYRLAVTYHNMQNYEASAATFRQILAKFPQSTHAAEARLRIGDYLLRDAGKPVESIPEFEAALQTDPKGPYAGRALKGLALARYETKDYDSAAELFLRLVREFPSVKLNEKTYAWVGQRYFDQQKWPEAAQVFAAMLDALPDHPKPERIRLKIAQCAENAGENDRAIELYDAVVQAAPHSSDAVEARWNMAKLFEARGDMDKAVALYEAAANTDTSDTAARARFRLGEIYEAREEFDAAARSYMRIAILILHEQLSPESLWRAGRCFEQAGKTDQARKAYQDLMKEYPQSEQAAKAAEQLRHLG